MGSGQLKVFGHVDADGLEKLSLPLPSMNASRLRCGELIGADSAVFGTLPLACLTVT